MWQGKEASQKGGEKQERADRKREIIINHNSIFRTVRGCRDRSVAGGGSCVAFCKACGVRSTSPRVCQCLSANLSGYGIEHQHVAVGKLLMLLLGEPREESEADIPPLNEYSIFSPFSQCCTPQMGSAYGGVEPDSVEPVLRAGDQTCIWGVEVRVREGRQSKCQPWRRLGDGEVQLLKFCLDIVDGVRRLAVEGDGLAGESVDKHLHAVPSSWRNTCIALRRRNADKCRHGEALQWGRWGY
ncbi:hypothetical protein BD410DRAFT_316715 [Rickenella mellea]|uniref:Uncharacterized protein n=1 Tax=Rickenella mellea TaxID=50990 RepID=A0A4Y7Q0F9_9AGAM|nr:hypothetical protein BD410DRAFT_316715 [Rickenella mellea]